MSITQDLAAVAVAADNLTQQVTDKIGDIDARVNQFQTDANNIVSTATADLRKANIGNLQTPNISITAMPDEDVGIAVNQAYSDGAKHVTVDWEADGQLRHWNTLVSMPTGASLTIAGPESGINTLGGNARTEYGCFANSENGGVSTNGSPMIFRNLTPTTGPYPLSDHYNVYDNTSLIQLVGNNTVTWGAGTYLHDQGGMIGAPLGSGLIRIASYKYGLPNFVGGGLNFCQFYLSGPFVNNLRGTSTCEIRMQRSYFRKTTSDGPMLNVDKGFKRLQNQGVAGITNALLSTQPYEITTEQAALNDNLHADYSIHSFNATRGNAPEDDRPRIIGNTSSAYPTGWILAQFWGGFGETSATYLYPIEGTNVYLGAG